MMLILNIYTFHPCDFRWHKMTKFYFLIYLFCCQTESHEMVTITNELVAYYILIQAKPHTRLNFEHGMYMMRHNLKSY